MQSDEDARQPTPDVLVLGGGGILGEAWMSALLAGLEEQPGFDARRCGAYLGTSAGSIVAASLVAGLAPTSRLDGLPEQPSAALPPVPHAGRGLLSLAAGLGGTAVSPLVSRTMTSIAAGGALMRRVALEQVPAGRRSLAALGTEIERIGATWDGRLRIAIVDRRSGRRIVVGAAGSPVMPVAAAVQASCAIPGVFAPIRFGGRDYVDGGTWSPTNMDAAEVERGQRILCLNPTGGFRPRIGSAIGVIGPVSRMAAGAEALVLQRKGARVTTINPDDRTLSVMGSNLMDPGPRTAVIAAGLAQGRRIAAAADSARLAVA
jgi:NTE family protein